MKKCSVCRQTKQPSEFKTVNGKPIPKCKNCHAKYQRQWYNDNKELFNLQRNARNLTSRVRSLLAKADELGVEVKLDSEDGFSITLEVK